MNPKPIVFSPRAQQRLEEIADYLSRQKLSNTFVLDYLSRFENDLNAVLGQFPESGTRYSKIQSVLPSTDKVGAFIVFNIGGNKYRLIASIHFNRGKVYIRHILTHREYDKGAWKE